MYNVKQQIYLYFDKTQKSHLCSFLRSFVKQKFRLTIDEIYDEFVEDQDYYLKINSSRFEFLTDYLYDDEFARETKRFIGACKVYYEQKEAQRPYIEKQKEFEKEKRKFLQNVKMSKEKPTKKQLYYYEKLCKRYNIEKKDTKTLSKLDLKNEIAGIIDEHSTDCRNFNE